MRSAVATWVKIGLASLTFIVLGKAITGAYKVPVLSNLFAAA